MVPGRLLVGSKLDELIVPEVTAAWNMSTTQES
jgi:hypothetical protein